MVVLQVYEAQGIRDGAPQNQMKGPAFKTELATAYPECRLVVTKETLTVEGMIKASPHNCVCGLRPIFCSIRAVIKGGNTYSIPALL